MRIKEKGMRIRRRRWKLCFHLTFIPILFRKQSLHTDRLLYDNLNLEMDKVFVLVAGYMEQTHSASYVAHFLLPTSQEPALEPLKSVFH
jgi:hypothetical protein